MPKKKPAEVPTPEVPTPEVTAEQPKRLLPEQILALNRITSDKLIKAARSQVKSGARYEIDFGVRVRGQVLVGHDGDYAKNNVPEALDLVQGLLAHFGPKKRRAIVAELILTGIARTIAPDDTPIEGLPELAQHLIDSLTTTTKGSRRGSVTGICDVTLVEWS